MKNCKNEKNRMKYVKDNLAKARYYKTEGDLEKSKDFAIEEFKLKIIHGNLKKGVFNTIRWNKKFDDWGIWIKCIQEKVWNGVIYSKRI